MATLESPDHSGPHVGSHQRTSQEMTDAYKHGIILESEFRVLELLPGEEEDEIICELRTEPLRIQDRKEANVHYEALSYTWGFPAPTRQIVCSGKTFNVRLNLYQALKRIRRKDKRRRLWVDAICINQFDIVERNQHVQRMDVVFASAERVLVWLGEENREEGEGVLDVLPTWLAKYPPHIDWHAANIMWDDSSFSFSFSSHGLSGEAFEWLSYQQTNLMHLLHFFARRWWTRKWVIQEIVQAKEALLICGKEQKSWASISNYLNADQDKFSLWHDSLARVYNNHPDKAFVNCANDGIFHSRQLARMAANFDGPEALNLWDVVYETNDFKCTEQRDNLYSLFAIAADVRNSTETDLLQVDYSDSISTVSVNYCCWLIENDPYSLICLRTVPGSRGCSEAVPSWTPNIVPVGWMQRPDLRRPLSTLCYNAGCLEKNSKPSWTLRRDNYHLLIKGIITETITNVLPPPYIDITSFGWLHFGKGHAVWLRKCHDTIKSIITTPEQVDYLMYQLLTCGGERAHSLYTRDWHSPTVETCRRWLDVVFDESSTNDPNVYADSDLSAMTASIVYAKWRQFCVTSEGRFGWVPAATQIGDKICVLLGGKVPLAISDCGHGHHNLMGEAYVHGIMDGETIGSGLPVEMIELC
ncbi:uncharacterized protein PV09_02635 [Verruconis gallopava]|uniref:Heterokaryon incompatibility domain-containing protein n=1 Tax=Verruconis gallopava TaxID=253628 RepID=A0A0D2AK92_9PEZI|nr:uncharacterized protein PV09_02635 [Verruconis gallopava]KIW06975.1 hypothetical protein PV09_02635 [Verruconis gallopava]